MALGRAAPGLDAERAVGPGGLVLRIDDGEHFLLFDPPAPPSEIVELAAEREPFGHLYSAGDRLAIGIESFPGRKHNDLVLWIEGV